MLFPIPVKQIERIEGNNSPIGMRDVHAGFLDAADVKSMRVDKLDDQHSEDILVAEFCRRSNFRQAAEEFTQRVRAGLRRMIGGEKFEEAVTDALLLFVDDRIASGVDEHFGLDKTRTSPNDSSSRIVAWKLSDGTAASMMNALVSTPAGVPARLPNRLTPLAPLRMIDQSMPR